MKIEDIAEVCYEANRAYCVTLNDHTQVDWYDAPEWQKDSAIDGVQFHIENRDADDAASHRSWLSMKAADGWRYGPVKDASIKQHPYMVPFEELPIEQQLKDRLFRSICHALIPYLDLKTEAEREWDDATAAAEDSDVPVIIKPTIGRVMWFMNDMMSDQPLAATVAYVHSVDRVNLSVSSKDGFGAGWLDIPVHHGDPVDCPDLHCCWMPYQLEQAKKRAE